jgi:small subunit ribosomal protein S18
MPKKEQKTERIYDEAPRRRSCLFCDEKKTPTYTDAITLRKFLSDRSKIIPRSRSGACSKHQRLVAREIKHARHLALLPFVTKL